jgi:hypothetical protein
VQDHLSKDSIQTDRRERKGEKIQWVDPFDSEGGSAVESFASTVLDEWTGGKEVSSRSDLSISSVNRLDAKAVEEIFSAAVE